MKQNALLTFCRFLLLVGIFLLLSCQQSKFLLEQDVVRVPMRILPNGELYSFIIVNDSDTVPMLIDTGTSDSFLNSASLQNTLRRRIVFDSGGFAQWLPISRADRINWGELKIENLYVITSNRNIIGNDILRNFYVKFDFENSEIVLTKNSLLIEKGDIRMPFETTFWGIPKINLSINGEDGYFIFDTGFDGELGVITSFFHSSGLSDLENVEWIGGGFESLFSAGSLIGEDTDYFALVNCRLQDIVFENTLVYHNANIARNNKIGTIFMRRFQSITIDYLNGFIYFKLPEDNAIVSFSDNPIEAVPIAYLKFLYNHINSFGIEITRRYPYSVRRLRKNSVFTEKGIEIGDMLVGINQVIFSETVFGKLESARDSFRLETNRSKQQAELNDVFFRRNKATFHFLKNGKLISIDKVRDKILYPAPKLAYGFYSSSNDLDLDFAPGGFFAYWHSVHPNKKFSVHIPWSPLMGEEHTLSVFVGGEQHALSNNPDAPNPFLDNEN